MKKKYLELDRIKNYLRNEFSDSPWISGSRLTMIISALEEVPEADVMSRDCYDHVLFENDQMCKQLATIGKKPGDSMEDVERVVYAEWIALRGTHIQKGAKYLECSNCHETIQILGQKPSVCLYCGARMAHHGHLVSAPGDV